MPYTKEFRREYIRKWQRKNMDKVVLNTKEWKNRNPEKAKKYARTSQKNYLNKHRERLYQQAKEWKNNNPGKCQMQYNKWKEKTNFLSSSGYCATRLARYTILTSADIPQQLIELYKLKLIAERMLSNGSTQNY